VSDFTDSFWNAVPHWMAGAIAIIVFLVYLATRLTGVHEGITAIWPKIAGLLTRRDRERKNDVDYQIADLWRQVNFLEEQLAELRLRDEMYWSWILTDQEWHRTYEFKAAQNGWETVPHMSFMEFRDRWMSQRRGRRPGNNQERAF
jgi:hypothetical protein